MPLGANKAAIMGVAGTAVTGDVVLLSSQTASNSASIDFTSKITSKYVEYIFYFYNINPATDAQNFTFQVNASGQSGYNESIVSTFIQAYHNEAGTNAAVAYETNMDQVGTSFQGLANSVGNGADESCSGELHLFNPSSTTYLKHWYSRVHTYYSGDYANDDLAGGYFNFTAALTNVQFKMASGNFDGIIKMWGVK